MFKPKLQLAIAALATLLASHFITNVNAQQGLPKTRAGETMKALLTAVNGDDAAARVKFLKEGFAENDEATMRERTRQTEQVRSQLGTLKFKKTLSSKEDSLSVVCSTSNGPDIALSIDVNDESPARISRVQIEMLGDDEPDVSPLDKAARAGIIKSLASELRLKYVFPKVAEKMASSVESSLSKGQYSKFDDASRFAAHLTEQLRAICNDRHLRVRPGVPRRAGRRPGERPADNHGFVKAEMLPGGIGYLKFNYFSGDVDAEKTASAAMSFLGQSKAIIFDLRENGGGSPRMIAYLTSYLFDKSVHLNSFYNRPTDTTTESWTRKTVPGERFDSNVPVYVLTSSRTFSGAEEFSYNLRNLKRATLVGETTGGGAHPVMPVMLGKRMHMSMPFARAINPITNTNWEGVGVKPHVEVAAEKALDQAVKLAKQQMQKAATTAAQTPEKTETVKADVSSLVEDARQLLDEESFAEAAKVLAKITKLDPEDEVALFQLGYALHMDGQLDRAIEVHKRAAKTRRFAGIATYNLACAYSLQKKPNDAFVALEKAIELGFGDVQQIEGDTDLDNLRKDKRYAKLIEKLKDKS